MTNVTRGLSRLYGEQGMVPMLRGIRPNQFCECAIVGLITTFYIVMCVISMTTFQLTVLGKKE